MTLAHITARNPNLTYAVAIEQRDLALATHTPLPDETARTIASWYHSPGPCCQHTTALSHGLPFDTDELRAEIHYEIEPIDARDAEALQQWLRRVEERAG